MSSTAIIGVLFIIVILGTDVWLWIKNGINGTFSRELIEDSHKYPIIAFLVGFLIGHWYG